jgi:bacillithiol system protein YtxJ
MSFFSGLRGMIGKRPELPEQWTIPETESDIDELFQGDGSVRVIYKHSYNCGTCMFAKTRVEQVMKSHFDKASFYFIDVIAARKLSRRIEETSGIRHESPQLILLKNGKPFWHASHGGIQPGKLEEALAELNA